MTTQTLAKSYTPADAEPEVTRRWADARAFHAEPDDPGRPYCVLIPPPNVTAALHLGHALNNTLQDVLVRYHRMRGFNTLWMPGTDHAGIATQTVVDKRLKAEGQPSLIDYKKIEADGGNGREQFIEKVQAWKDEYEATIIDQLKAMGCSCDFERTRFTMDEMCAKAVREAFFRLFKDGLIYRGKRLVNWDPVTQTALADDEVEMHEIDGHFWYLRYPLVHPPQNPDDPYDCEEVTWSELAARGYPGAEQHPDDETAWVTVATTRPETYLGDTGVAVHPDDPRAGPLRGLMAQLPIVGRVIPIVEDDYVVRPDPQSTDPKAQYASGFLKVTPAHDQNDWEIGQRHGLKVINVMAPDATISDQHGWSPDDVGDAHLFLGKSREDARELVVREFEARGLLEATKPYRHSVGHSYRSHVPIEPYLSDQWYVRVTDDSMKGQALRALVDDQHEGAPPEPATEPTSRDREGAEYVGAAPARPLNDCAYLISFTCYGTWLHGDERGAVDTAHNLPGTPVMLGNEDRERREFESMAQKPVNFGVPERRAVQDAIVEVCRHRGWRLLALSVRTNHAHAVVVTDSTPEKAMNDFKAYATRRLRGEGLVSSDRRIWTRHGSTRYLNDESSVKAAARYVVEQQGAELDPAPIDRRAGIDAFSPAANEPDAKEVDRASRSAPPLPHGRGSLDAQSRPGDGALRFYPGRYAKMYQSWHENIRDWCISRQLWWGHRIPVWRKTIDREFNRNNASGRDWDSSLEPFSEQGLREDLKGHISFQSELRGSGARERFLCIAPDCPEIESEVVAAGYTQDPDVLDTWFSSALWPLSTMGWPEPEAYPETRGLLDTFNPTSVLCTARDIITLWVSRMVMFNRYFRDGTVPFHHVYIHPMIQDGHGQRMSKSLGNGVDPRDIIGTHGADALRYTLTQMATTTQDVRLPLDLVCPHTGETFTPKTITTPAGHIVPAPIQTCPSDPNRKMVTAYGVASGQAQPSDDMPLAVNASQKFDIGRNFCNKLWNATRFALGTINQAGASIESVHLDDLPLIDRWMLARLWSTLDEVNNAVSEYQFNVYAELMYDLIWRDFCDWYLEGIKPTVRDNPSQQQVLVTALNAMLRMLHPICPFVTETLWPHVTDAREAGVRGFDLPGSDLCATASWPAVPESFERGRAADDVAPFDRIQALINAVRQIRSEHQTPPKQKIRLHAPQATRDVLSPAADAAHTLAGLASVDDIESRPADAVVFTFEGREHAVSGLAGHLDRESEKKRIEKTIADLEKQVAALRKRLDNPGYVNKAPAHLVEETRQQLRQAEADLDTARRALQSMQS